MNAEDRELLQGFRNALSGLLCTQHFEGQTFQIKLTLEAEPDRLTWRGGRPLSEDDDIPRNLLVKDISLVSSSKSQRHFHPTTTLQNQSVESEFFFQLSLTRIIRK